MMDSAASNAIARFDAPGTLQRLGDLVRLHHVADAEAGQHAEHGEGNRQPVPVPAQAIADVVHGAADVVAQFVALAVADRQQRLGVLGGHAHQRDHPHPEQRAGAADQDGAGHAGDVARPHRGRQRGHQGPPTGDIAGTLGGAALPQQPEGIAQVAQRGEAQAEHQVQAGAADQHQQGRTPHEVVNGGEQVHGIHARELPWAGRASRPLYRQAGAASMRRLYWSAGVLPRVGVMAGGCAGAALELR
jgi:hypothetical protein